MIIQIKDFFFGGGGRGGGGGGRVQGKKVVGREFGAIILISDTLYHPSYKSSSKLTILTLCVVEKF